MQEHPPKTPPPPQAASAVLSAEQALARLPALAPAAHGRPLNLKHLLKEAVEKIKITLTVPEGAGRLQIGSQEDALRFSADSLHISGNAEGVREMLAHLRYLPQHEGKAGILHFSLWDGDVHVQGIHVSRDS